MPAQRKPKNLPNYRSGAEVASALRQLANDIEATGGLINWRLQLYFYDPAPLEPGEIRSLSRTFGPEPRT